MAPPRKVRTTSQEVEHKEQQRLANNRRSRESRARKKAEKQQDPIADKPIRQDLSPQERSSDTSTMTITTGRHPPILQQTGITDGQDQHRGINLPGLHQSHSLLQTSTPDLPPEFISFVAQMHKNTTLQEALQMFLATRDLSSAQDGDIRTYLTSTPKQHLDTTSHNRQLDHPSSVRQPLKKRPQIKTSDIHDRPSKLRREDKSKEDKNYDGDSEQYTSAERPSSRDANTYSDWNGLSNSASSAREAARSQSESRGSTVIDLTGLDERVVLQRVRPPFSSLEQPKSSSTRGSTLELSHDLHYYNRQSSNHQPVQGHLYTANVNN